MFHTTFLVFGKNPRCDKMHVLHHGASYTMVRVNSKKQQKNSKVFHTTFLVLGKNPRCDKIHVVHHGTSYTMVRINSKKQQKNSKAAGSNDRAAVRQKQQRTQQQRLGFRGRTSKYVLPSSSKKPGVQQIHAHFIIVRNSSNNTNTARYIMRLCLLIVLEKPTVRQIHVV